MRVLVTAGFAVLTLSFAVTLHGAGADEAAMGTWTKKAPMRFARSELQAAAVNGKIYVVGGGHSDVRDGKPFESITNGETRRVRSGHQQLAGAHADAGRRHAQQHRGAGRQDLHRRRLRGAAAYAADVLGLFLRSRDGYLAQACVSERPARRDLADSG